MAKRHNDHSQAPGGRPSKFNAETTAIILDGLRNNLTQRLSAHKAGLHEDTYYLWMKAGQEDMKAGVDSDLAEFFRAVVMARAEHAQYLAQSYCNGDRYWMAKDKLLAKLYREDYGDEGEEVKRLKQMLTHFMEIVSKSA